MDRRLAVFLVCLSVAVAGCGSVGSSTEPDPVVDRSADDRLGVENGVSANASLDVTTGDGFDRWELAAVVDRTMARVELLRGLEFVEPVETRVVSRAELRDDDRFGGGRAHRQLRAQVHEATFLLGEDESVPVAYERLYDDRVAGYYNPTADEIVLVANDGIDTRTLAHELVHALQDQHFGVTPTDGRDARVAATGLREGDARYVDTLYAERCETEWSCLPSPDGDAAGDYNRELFAMLYQPYADGAQFVHELRQRGGWDTVDAAYADPPTATEQTIHPEAYPAETPVSVDVTDRSGDEWQPVVGAENETLGELGAYVTLLASGAVDAGHHTTADGPYSPRNYSHPATAGWAGDTFVAYTDGDRAGYVWKLRWESPSDAQAFAAAYRDGLQRQNARSVGNNTYVISEDPFADAFRINRDGDTVVVVNAPTVSDLEQIRSTD